MDAFASSSPASSASFVHHAPLSPTAPQLVQAVEAPQRRPVAWRHQQQATVAVTALPVDVAVVVVGVPSRVCEERPKYI